MNGEMFWGYNITLPYYHQHSEKVTIQQITNTDPLEQFEKKESFSVDATKTVVWKQLVHFTLHLALFL